jgi:prepilin-type processing-associated H-X9-DG protein
MNGVAPHGNPPVEWSETNNIKWKIEIPGKGSATPVVWGERIFVLTAVPSGKASAQAKAEPAATERQRGPRGSPPEVAQRFTVLAFQRSDGKLLWQRVAREELPHEGTHPTGTWASGSPITDGEMVYAFFGSRGLYAYDMSGSLKWEKDLGDMTIKLGFGEGSSPALYGGRLIVLWDHEGQSFVTALDKKTGKEIWRAAVPDLGSKGRDGAAYSSIVVSEGAGVRQYVQLLGRGVAGVRAADGKFLWGNNSVANGTANISTPVVRGDYVFASTGYQTGSVLLKLNKRGDAVEAGEVYFLDNKTFQNHHGGFVLVGEHLYGGNGHRLGFPTCIEFATGRVVWGGDIRNEGKGSAAVAYADGHVYFRYEDGTVILVEATPAGYKPKGHFTIPNVRMPSWPHPVIAGGRLYLREQDSLYVYDVRG